MRDADVDGVAGSVVFCSWTGDNPLTPTRADCLLSIYRETCCPVMYLHQMNIARWIRPAFPFHRAYDLLSATQKADYLRCYLMHHYGGGYTDMKRTSKSWQGLFQTVRESPSSFGLGYTEIGPHGVSPVGQPLEAEMRANFHKLIGNCAYIFRRQTEFTTAWMTQTHAMLDANFDALQAHPAQHPMDHRGATLPDGTVSHYPLVWMAFCNIFHPLIYAHSDRILHDDIAPSFRDYR